MTPKRVMLQCARDTQIVGQVVWWRVPVPGDINIEQVEAIRAMVEQSLPSGVRSAMRQAGIALILGSSTDADIGPVLVDQDLADELAEKELVEEMVSYRKDVTGMDHTVFISPKGHTRHGARIKL